MPNVLIWGRFSTLAAMVVPWPEKVVNIRPKHFFAVLIGNAKNCTLKGVGMFRALNGIIWPRFKLFLLLRCPGPEKVVKIFSRPFLLIWMRNKRKCVPNIVLIFRVPKSSHLDPIFNFACSCVTLAVLMGNDKKCTQKSVPMFQALNRVIWAPFLTFPAPVLLRPKKVVTIRPNYFSTVLRGNNRNYTTNCVAMFQVPNVVIWDRFLN